MTQEELLAALTDPLLRAAVERIIAEQDEWKRSFELAEQLLEQTVAHYNRKPPSLWTALKELLP